MVPIKALGLSILALIPLSTMTTVVASAEEGLLPNRLTAFWVQGGKSTINTAANLPIVCTILEPSKGVLITDKHSTVLLEWLKCSIAGIALNSAGVGSGEVLAQVLFLVCLIKSNELKFGMAVETDTTLNLESPALGIKITVKGRVIGEVLAKAGTKVEAVALDFTGKEGKQSVTTCTDSNGTKEHTLQVESSLTKKAETASLSIEKGTIFFEEDLELMDV
jgi:hypothetical protein